MGRLGSAHVSFSDLSPCPPPDDSLSNPLCVRPWAWCQEHRGRGQSPCLASWAHREQERPSQQR